MSQMTQKQKDAIINKVDGFPYFSNANFKVDTTIYKVLQERNLPIENTNISYDEASSTINWLNEKIKQNS